MGGNEQTQPAEGWPFSINAGETSLTKTILKEIVSAWCSSSIWVMQLLVLAQSGEWQWERNNQMVSWKVGGLLEKQYWLMPVCSVCTTMAFAEAFFVVVVFWVGECLVFWDICKFRSLPQIGE